MRQDMARAGPLEKVVHWTLLGGVIASAGLLAYGLVLVLASHAPRAEAVHDPGALLRLALRGNGVAVLDLGLIVLMLTPAARVVVLGLGWLVRRQWHMALVAVAVAALLSLSIALGAG
jgi:hypothetical protein